MLSTGLVALDNTVVATAAPAVVGDLGGIERLPWVFSVYLLAQASATPLMGKLCDLLGRRPVMLAGITAFAAGSLAAGLAWDMPALIGARVLQGLGAGAVQAAGLTVIGDRFDVHERGRAQGWLSGVWGVSSVLGPLVGGALADTAGWRWVFLINLPLCVVAATVFAAGQREPRVRPATDVDYAGAALLTTGCSLAILTLLTGGRAWPAALAAGAVLGLFVLVERRAANPVLPGRLVRDRTALGSNLANIGLGAIMMGVNSYVPLYAQTVLGAGALASGLAIAPLMIGWPLAAAYSAKAFLRFGFRTAVLAGVVVAVLGALGLALVRPGTPLALLGLACFVIGLGLGLSTTPLMLAVQTTAGHEHRGALTASVMFSRSFGSAVGVAALGAAAGGFDRDGLHRVFTGLAVVALLMLAAAALMRRGPVFGGGPVAVPLTGKVSS
ncbi:MFS transporter [Paractinoplanes ferrugineus]